MKSETDWARLNAMTEEEIERNALDDPDNPPMTEDDWKNARVVWPQGKAPVTLRLDRDIIAWFKARGRGYQTRINAVLRGFVEAQKPRGWPTASGVSSEPRIRLNQRAKHQKARRP
ncbi:MAG TPA: BrnA antitoxin family protein [Stellaceae bacterium]|nr:BrnA antitoxin family protein [Stellaceae bacterium]